MGAAALLEKHPDLFRGVGFVITEGGANETIVDKVAYWGIEVEQKLPLWIRITTRGRPSHSAVPPENGGSAAALVKLLAQLETRPRPERLTPGVERMFESLAQTKKGEKGEVLRDIRKHLGTSRMAVLSTGYRALLRSTQAITTIRAGTSANSMPAASSATLDIRLLPDEQPDRELQAIRTIVGKAGEVEVLLQAAPAPASSTDTELYQALSRAMRRAEPESVVGPMVGAGTSDARFFRARGITAYGISPFKVNYYDADTVHGRDERIRTAFFHQGVRLMKDVLRDFCAVPAK
jgi:acetylornithine deacetylase/succinyl-diaminopimelate desuccinylase-like protein